MAARIADLRRAKRSDPFLRSLPDLDVVPHVDRAAVCELLRALDAGDASRVAGALALIRARPHLISSLATQQQNPLDAYQAAILESTDRDLDLVRLSLTAARGRDRDLAPTMHAYAAWIADQGVGCGAVLAIDVRRDGTRHVYGIAAFPRIDRELLRSEWCARSGASAFAMRGSKVLQAIGGWHHYAMTGDASLVRGHLVRVLAYSNHDLVTGEVRDLDSDVAASGPLAAPWRAFREALATSGASTPVERLHAIGPKRSTACLICGGSMVGKRAGAETCSPKCRKARHLATKRDAERRPR